MINKMSATPPSAASGLDQQVVGLIRRCEQAVAARQPAIADDLLRQAAALDPLHPLVLHEQARRRLLAGDAVGATPLLERAVVAAPKHLPLWLTLASALRLQRRFREEFGALDHALEIDPLHVGALLLKGAALDNLGQPRSAGRIYTHALQARRPGVPLPQAMEPLVRQAERRVQEMAAELEAHFDSKLAAMREGQSASEVRRFGRAFDMLLGRASIYTPAPTLMMFPWLRNYEFFDRERFPWLAQLEAATEAVREEMLAVLHADEGGLEPYITYGEGQPLAQWAELNHSRRWTAYFFWKVGEFHAAHAARCPRTVAALRATPQVDIPGFGPTAFYSVLDARTHIPVHTGAANTRLTVHLPLIVPPGCGFRVGGETREWKVGEAWVFDDTIEHEAWNKSDEVRVILLFDIWNPELTPLERDLVRATKVLLAEYYQNESPLAVSL